MILIILKGVILRHAPRMTNSPQIPPTSRTGTILLGLAIALSLGVIFIPTFFTPEAQLMSGEWFVGGDTYMRVVRVREWLDAGSWYQNVSARSNAPYGETLHWTRPLDMALVALAAPFMPFVGLDKALYFAGFIVSPLMLGLTLWAFLWGTRRLLDARGQIILVVLLTFQPVTHYYFAAARPDHHSMILLCFAAVVAFLVRHAIDPEAESRTVTWAGVITALGIWVSVESLTIELYALLVLGMLWIFTGRAVWLDGLRRFTLAGAVTIALALMIERPPGEWLTSETFDRLSTVQAVLLALIALGVEAIKRSHGRLMGRLMGGRFKAGVIGRLTATLLAAGAAAMVMAALYPAFFKGPFSAAMDPRLNALWLSKVVEFQPLFGADQSMAVETIYLLGPLTWGIVWTFLVWRKPDSAPHIPALVAVLGLSMAIFAPLTMLQTRWGGYLGIAVIIPWTLLLVRLLDWRGGPIFGPTPGTPVLRTPLFLLVATGHILVSGAYLATGLEVEPPKVKQCEWRKLAPYLNSPQFANGEAQTFFNFIHTGPEILYRTKHRVVGTPYHRNARGLLDSYTVLGGTDMSESKAILQARQVDFVLLCVATVEERLLLDFPGETLLRRLVDAAPPKWLAEEPLPDGLNADFRFYRFVPHTP